MSRIGKQPVRIPSGVDVAINGAAVSVKGPKGTLMLTLHPHVTALKEGTEIRVTVASPDEKGDRALWGLSQRLLQNMIVGVTKGFQKKLELVGVGYKAAVSGKTLTLNLGFSHPNIVVILEGLTVSVDKTVVTIAGSDKELVGNFAAKVRALRKPEPYKGKGVKYEGEVIRRKAGKAAKTATAA